MPKGTNRKANVTMSVTSMGGETLTEVVATRNTKVEDVKKMIAIRIATDDGELCSRLQQDDGRRWFLWTIHGWFRHQLVYGTQVLQNSSTLAQSGVRGKVTLCVVMNGCESEESKSEESESEESEGSMPHLCDSESEVEYIVEPTVSKKASQKKASRKKASQKKV